jgi:hypothetical protein
LAIATKLLVICSFAAGANESLALAEPVESSNAEVAMPANTKHVRSGKSLGRMVKGTLTLFVR